VKESAPSESVSGEKRYFLQSRHRPECGTNLSISSPLLDMQGIATYQMVGPNIWKSESFGIDLLG
jgi:hypothetical protein